MFDASKTDVIKKTVNCVMAIWESMGLSTMEEKPIYYKVQTLVRDAEKLRSAKPHFFEDSDWTRRKKAKFEAEFDISPKHHPPRTESSENTLEDAPMVR